MFFFSLFQLLLNSKIQGDTLKKNRVALTLKNAKKLALQ